MHLSGSITAALASDARQIAITHAAARRGAYRGLVPDADLAAESIEQRTTRWERRLADEEARCWLLKEGPSIDGFASTGPARDDGVGPRTAELMALYLLPQFVGHGFGRRLSDHALADLATRGYEAVILWVAQDNDRAVRFYRAAGFEPDERVAPGVLKNTDLSTMRMIRRL